MATLNPYLNFKGNAEDAFNFYKSVFGGEFAVVQRFKELPGDYPQNPEHENKILHIALPVGDGNMLMASDVVGAMADKITFGTNINIIISPKTEEETHRIFNALSAGGEVNMPLQLMFWGDLFSHFTDKFGVNWMISYNEKYHQQ